MQYGLEYEQLGSPVQEPTSAWVELRCVEAGRGGDGGGDGLTGIALDPRKELVWAGTSGGMLHAHVAGDLSRVVSVNVGGDVRALTVADNGVLVAVPRGLAVMSRGGIVRTSLYADTIAEPSALALNPFSDGQCCIGGDSRMLAVVDWESSRILRQAALRGASHVTDAAWFVPPASSSLCVFGTRTGRISVCNPSTMREVNAVVAFAGNVTSVACSGYVIATTGCAPHGGVAYMEQSVKMFDIRQMNTPLPSIPFVAGPSLVEFDEWAQEAICNGAGSPMWALSPNGALQCFDVAQPPGYPLSPELHLDSAQDTFTCMKVSKQGLLVLGDTGGFIHEWSATDYAQVNANSEALFDSPVAKNPVSQLNGELSRHMDQMLRDDKRLRIPRFITEPRPDDEELTYLSDTIFKHLDKPEQKVLEKGSVDSTPGYETAFARRAWGTVQPRIQENILRSVKRQGFVGYAQAPPGFRPNTMDGHRPYPVVQRSRTDNSFVRRSWKPPGSAKEAFERRINGVNINGGDDSGDELTEVRDSDNALLLASGRSKYVEMDLVAAESIDGFNFLRYNRSDLFCGLENTLTNVYVNAAVQALYFTPPLRHSMLKHNCSREECISCELGFLFHMIDLGGPGMACEAGNFTKVFSKMANAEALGLLDGKGSLPPSQRIENFTRYLLEQLHQDSQDGADTTVSELLGSDVLSGGKYIESGTLWERKSRPFQHTLVYDGMRGKAPESFCDLVENSLSRSMDLTRAFCETSNNYEMMSSKRCIKTLPNLLLFGCNTKSKESVRWWDAGHGLGTVDSMRSPSSPEVLENIAQEAMKRKAKLAPAMRVEVGESSVSVVEIDDVETEFGYNQIISECESVGATNLVFNSGDSFAEYDLAFVIAYVPPTLEESTPVSTNSQGHLVSYIKVPEKYKEWKRERGAAKIEYGSRTGAWYCFNDFVIAPCASVAEVCSFDSRWKVPCLIAYVRRDVGARMEVYGPRAEENAVDIREVIGGPGSNNAYALFDEEERPGEGTMFALDCEFVMTARDEAIIWGDGTRQVVSPAKMALGRVSVIRADGPRKGIPIIDDYIEVKEPVVDYLTRFSGLMEGDLNPATSRFDVKSLKTVYRRLRCLVDAGCVFIGHGLNKDFRIINFVVPQKQVVDTVTLFRVGNRRLLGLRFLSTALLKSDIQKETHDSIEDAYAAMELYDLYKKVRGENGEGEERFQKLLHELYSYGYLRNFQVDPAQPFVPEPEVEALIAKEDVQ